MARVVVIFAILALITGAMFWFVRHPGFNHNDSVTLPVAPQGQPAVDAANGAVPKPADVPSPQDAASIGSDAQPPAEATSPGVALNPSGAEANVLQQQTTTTAPGAQTGLVVENVEPGGSNSLSLKGRADPGATIKVSVDGKAAGEVTVGSGGAWSLSVDRGKGEGEPKIALELVGADGKVLDKTNFVYKAAASVPPLAPQDESLVTQQTAVPKTKPAKPPHSAHGTFRVRHGESLWRIARRKLGDGNKWREIYEANREAIGGDPDFVRAGTRLVIPG